MGKVCRGEGPLMDTILYLGYGLKGTTSVQKKKHVCTSHICAESSFGFNILALALHYFCWNFDNCCFYENGLINMPKILGPYIKTEKN